MQIGKKTLIWPLVGFWTFFDAIHLVEFVPRHGRVAELGLKDVAPNQEPSSIWAELPRSHPKAINNSMEKWGERYAEPTLKGSFRYSNDLS